MSILSISEAGTVQFPMMRSSSSTFLTRAGLLAKRGSRGRSGRPISSASLANSGSELPAIKTHLPSEHG